MSKKLPSKYEKAKTSPDGWISRSTRSDYYGFSSVQHSTRASLTKEFVRVKQESPTQSMDASVLTNESNKVLITTTYNDVCFCRNDTAGDLPKVTPARAIRVKNPYISHTKHVP
jgi:hypothetical protein